MIHFCVRETNAAETTMMYVTLEWMLKQMFGDTADRVSVQDGF